MPARNSSTASKPTRGKAQDGMPMSLVVPRATAADWLAQIELRTRLLLEIRNGLAPRVRADADEAIRMAALARRAIVLGNTEGATWAAMSALQAAWCVELKVGARDMLVRDRALQTSKRKRRRPDIDKWIADKIRRHPDATGSELWAMRPEWIEDAIGLDRFRKRLTRVRAGRL